MNQQISSTETRHADWEELRAQLCKSFPNIQVERIQETQRTFRGASFNLTLALQPKKCELHILWLEVEERFRRTGLGIGEAVVDRLKCYAAAQQLQLLARSVDRHSRGFWNHERIGFRPLPYFRTTYICVS